MREPDAVDSARVLALALIVIAGTILLVKTGVPAVLAGAFQQAGLLAAPLLYGRWAGLRPLASSGFVPLPLRRAVLVLVASLGTFWLLNGLTHLGSEAVRMAGYEKHAEAERKLVERDILHAQDQGAVPALSLFVLIPPLCEETFFRGIVFRGLIARFGILTALATTSILFAFLHQMIVQKMLMVFVGCYFGLLVWLTGSLWAGILAHAVNNLAVLSLMWIYKGRLPQFVAPWWMYLFSTVVFGVAISLLALDRTAPASSGRRR